MYITCFLVWGVKKNKTPSKDDESGTSNRSILSPAPHFPFLTPRYLNPQYKPQA